MSPTQTVPECLDAVFNCDDVVPMCRNSAGFEFKSLWNITNRIAEQCPHSKWLFSTQNETLALTNSVCKKITGPSSWTVYPGSQVWDRLTTWKFPLFQLVANCPRPPLGLSVELFTIIHLLGDPIDTIKSILHKLDSCQTRAVFWQDRLDDSLSRLRGFTTLERERLWKSLTIIVDSFDEWGLDVGGRAQGCLLAELYIICSSSAYIDLRPKYLSICLRTGDALAADRSTQFLPVIVAQTIFISSVVIAMIRTQSSSGDHNSSIYINIETYSIAFTAQYFWLIFAVLFMSLIGASQSSEAIPRILRQFQQDLEKEMSKYGLLANLPIDSLQNKNGRIYNGGLYSWQPARRRTVTAHNSAIERRSTRNILYNTTAIERLLRSTVLRAWPLLYNVIPFFVVVAAAMSGQLISALVPPRGWSCRSTSMAWMFVTWVISSIIIVGASSNLNYRVRYWITMLKDLVAIGVTFGIVVLTQFGLWNRCDCYTLGGRVGLQLPFMPAANAILTSGLVGSYPAVVAIGIAFQLLIVPTLIIWRYHAAVQVYLQRDDGNSNFVFRNWRSSKHGGSVSHIETVVH